MTPQEQQQVNELFSRLVQLESAPRDQEAERLIADGVKKAPNATYALVQAVLVQDEALKRANAWIEELQAQLGDTGQPQRQQGGFLDSMRDALFGRNEPYASMPTARPQAAQPGSPGTPVAEPQPGYSAPRTAPGFAAAGPTLGSGGSFLGTAASAAAGVIGGGLLLNGIRSMFGHRPGFPGSDPFVSGGRSEDSTLRESNSGDDNLARQAGIDDLNENHIDQDQQDQNDSDDDGNFDDDDSYDV
ncbi:MAG TPA: DUF2076 domain-containing protein [Xanthobacteraceae bacterium]|jgi:hypothetical protein